MTFGLDYLPLEAQMMPHLKEVLSRMSLIFKRKKSGFLGLRERLQIVSSQKEKKRRGRENVVGVVAPEFDWLRLVAIRISIGLKFRGVVPTIKKRTANA